MIELQDRQKRIDERIDETENYGVKLGTDLDKFASVIDNIDERIRKAGDLIDQSDLKLNDFRQKVQSVEEEMNITVERLKKSNADLLRLERSLSGIKAMAIYTEANVLLDKSLENALLGYLNSIHLALDSIEGERLSLTPALHSLKSAIYKFREKYWEDKSLFKLHFDNLDRELNVNIDAIRLHDNYSIIRENFEIIVELKDEVMKDLRPKMK